MQTPFDVLGMGTVAVDDFIHVASYPPADEKREILKESRCCGGQIGTALAAAARLGARCTYAGLLGDDDLSEATRQSLREAGVDVHWVRNAAGAGPIHSLIVAESEHNTRTIFYNRGAVRPFPAGLADTDLLGQARVLLVDQLGIDDKIEIALRARALGVAVVADMEWSDLPGNGEFMKAIDHLILPRDFSRALTGKTDPAAMVTELHAPRACTAVTCGKEGCYYIDGQAPGRIRHQPAIEVRTVETTGCGDVFHGAYAASLARGLGVPESILTASAAAAIYASRPGGWKHLATTAEVEALARARS